MIPEICEYCEREPCICPVFDMPDEDENPDDPICPDHESDEEVPL